MKAFELEKGQLFFLVDHPLGPKLALVCEEIDEEGVRIALEANKEIKAILDRNCDVLRIIEA